MVAGKHAICRCAAAAAAPIYRHVNRRCADVRRCSVCSHPLNYSRSPFTRVLQFSTCDGCQPPSCSLYLWAIMLWKIGRCRQHMTKILGLSLLMGPMQCLQKPAVNRQPLSADNNTRVLDHCISAHILRPFMERSL